MSDAGGFERVCAPEDVPPATLRPVTLADGTRICVGNRGGTLFAVLDRCPHQRFPLSEGELMTDGTIVCAWHGAAYDCVSGRAVRGPKGDGGTREEPFGRLRHCEVRTANGELLVRPPTPDPRTPIPE